jgi:hypothetical protein
VKVNSKPPESDGSGRLEEAALLLGPALGHGDSPAQFDKISR